MIDASAAINQRAGIGRYARSMLTHLEPHLVEDQVTYWWAPDSLSQQDSEAWPGNSVRSPLTRRSIDRLQHRFGIPLDRFVRVPASDVAYSPDFSTPGRSDRSIPTIHDLAWRKHPESTPPGLAAFLESMVKRSIQNSDCIVAVSETTKSDIVDQFGVPSWKVVAARNGVDPRFDFQATSEADPENQLSGVPANYLLAVGTIQPRKNVANLLRGFDIAQLDLPLVIVGERGWDTHATMSELEKSVRSGRVIWLGQVEDRYLPELYRRASALVSVSWYEGFGLPVLEALASGIAVVASDISAHREVAGDCAIYVSPREPESIALGMHAALQDGQLDIRLRLARRARSTQFSWEESARVVADIIRNEER